MSPPKTGAVEVLKVQPAPVGNIYSSCARPGAPKAKACVYPMPAFYIFLVGKKLIKADGMSRIDDPIQFGMHPPPNDGGGVLVTVIVGEPGRVVQLGFVILWYKEAVDTGLDVLVVTCDKDAQFVIIEAVAPNEAAECIWKGLLMGEIKVSLREVTAGSGIGRAMKLIGGLFVNGPAVERKIGLTDKGLAVAAAESHF